MKGLDFRRRRRLWPRLTGVQWFWIVWMIVVVVVLWIAYDNHS